VRRQVLHQVQVKRQLLERQALKQRQDVFALVGVDKVVGVFDAASGTLDVLQLPQIQGVQERCSLVKRDFGVYGHA
jgi:hypothetical protein